ncbi:hypothetical protein SNEBB_008468 [Seison nebaliae]|nr:hypothetical protein SNEBB_008468 [Seison nebaliae]
MVLAYPDGTSKVDRFVRNSHHAFGGKAQHLHHLLGCGELHHCHLECEFGLERSHHTFCHVCQCASNPCEGVTCPSGEVCKIMKLHMSTCINEAFWEKIEELNEAEELGFLE